MSDVSETRTPIDFAARYGADAVRALGECQGKYASFINKRLSEDFALPQKLADCKSPMEIMDVWSNFYSTALGHYMDHAKQMTEAGSEAVEEFVRDAEEDAEEIAEATGKALKAMNNNGGTNKAA